MATIVSTVGSSGRNYATIALWQASLPANFVTAGNSYTASLYNDSEFLFSAAGQGVYMSGYTTDATHFLTMTAAAGQSWCDSSSSGGAYNVSNGVGIRDTDHRSTTLDIEMDYSVISRLQISGGRTAIGSVASHSYTNCTYNNNIMQTYLTYGSILTTGFGGGNNYQIYNNIFICNSSNDALAIGVNNGSTGNYIFNNTFVRPSDLVSSQTLPAIGGTSSSAATVTNNAIFGYPLVFSTGATLLTGSNNATDLSSITGSTSNLTSLTYSAQFRGVTSSAMDFRIATSGSSLGSGGIAITTPFTLSADAFGNPIPPYGIGATELPPTSKPISLAISATSLVTLSPPTGTGQGVYKSGTIRSEHGTGGTISTFAPGDVVGVAYDFGAKLWWIRVNGGNWNNSGTANPATGIGGISFADVAGPPFTPAFAWGSVTNDGATTTNFGASAFTYSAPSGYTGFTFSGKAIATAISATSVVTVTQQKIKIISVAITSTSTLSATVTNANARVYTLTSLTAPGTYTNGGEFDFSNDTGSVLCGTLYDASWHQIICIWTPGGGFTPITTVPSGYSSYPTVVAFSRDGTTIVAQAQNATTYATDLWIWTAATGMVAYPATGSIDYFGSASDDCSVLVGSVYPDAFVWTLSGGFNYIAPLTGGTNVGFSVVTGDGSLAIGTGDSATSSGMVVRWTAAGGLVADTLPAGMLYTTSVVGSKDASRLAASFYDGTKYHAYTWTAATGWVALGWLTGDTTQSVAGCGPNVVVGSSNGGVYGWRWTPTDGLVHTFDSLGVKILPGSGSATTPVSGDGSTITDNTSVNYRGNEYALAGRVYGQSYDGSVIVGIATGYVHPQYWIATGGVIPSSGAISASIASTSSQSVTAHKIGAIAETIASTSLQAATLYRTRAIVEAISSTSLQTAAIARLKQGLAEAITSISLQAGTLHRNRSLAEAIASTSLLTAAPHKIGVLTEAIASTSLQAGILHRSRAISEGLASTSLLGLALTRSRPISEAISAISLLGLALGKGGVLQASITATTSVAGILHKVGATKAAITSTTAVTSALRGIWHLSETITSTSTLAIALTRGKGGLLETVASTSAVTGTLSKVGALVETITSLSNVTCTLTPLVTVPVIVVGGPAGGRLRGGMYPPRRLSERQRRKEIQHQKIAARKQAVPASAPPGVVLPVVGLEAFRGGIISVVPVSQPTLEPYQSKLLADLEQIRVMAEMAAAEDDEEAVIALLLAA